MKKIKLSGLFLASLFAAFSHTNNASEIASPKSILPSKKTVFFTGVGVGVTVAVVYCLREGHVWVTPKILKEFTEGVRNTIGTTFIDIRTLLTTKNTQVRQSLCSQQETIKNNNMKLTEANGAVSVTSQHLDSFSKIVKKDSAELANTIKNCSSAVHVASENALSLQNFLSEQCSSLQVLQACKSKLRENKRTVAATQKRLEITDKIIDETINYNKTMAQQNLQEMTEVSPKKAKIFNSHHQLNAFPYFK